MDPFVHAPLTPFSTWTPMKGNTLVSSRYCKTLLPPSFETSELNLAELLDIALQNNPSTKETWASARAYAAQYSQSLSSFYPNAKIVGSFFREKGSFISPFPKPVPYFYTQAGPDLEISYTLFDFGQRSAAAMEAREALYYADFSHNQNIQDVMQIVMNDYYGYLYQTALMKSYEANLVNAQSALDAANEKFALGLAALGEVAQARTQYLQSKINLNSQKQNVENAYAQLSVDIGLPANLTFKVQPMPDQVCPDAAMDSVDILVAQAQDQRQDFLAAKADIRSKEAALKAAKRAVYPVFSTYLDGGHYWFDQGFEETFWHWNATLTVTIPLFEGFNLRNQIRLAEAKLEYSQAQLMQRELSIIQQVTIAHMGVKTAAQNLLDCEEYLNSAMLEFNISLSGYKAGTATILDVLSSQSALSDARSKKAGAQKDWFTALAHIAYATGSLCSGPEEYTCEPD